MGLLGRQRSAEGSAARSNLSRFRPGLLEQQHGHGQERYCSNGDHSYLRRHVACSLRTTSDHYYSGLELVATRTYPQKLLPRWPAPELPIDLIAMSTSITG